MKNIKNYILEKYLINSDTEFEPDLNNILNNIDINKWSWPKHGISDQELDKCKENVENFAKILFTNIKPNERVEELYKETIKLYIKSDHPNYSEKFIEDEYNNIIKNIKDVKKYGGWGQYESNCVVQGWWHFVNWIYEQYIKNK